MSVDPGSMTPEQYQAYADKMAADAERFYDRIEASEAQPGASEDAATSTGNDFPTADHDDSDTSNSTSYDPSDDVDTMDEFEDFDDDLF
ncbi:hypothetical protein [Streptomyces cinereoruber]|uniref:hypothetical protein n=2 Tax=Streptomyces cinereoruber TaxID=67260 RepID=UPI003638E14B